MSTLLDGVKGMLTDAVLDKASSLIGVDSSTTSSALDKFLPAIIGGLISKGSNASGAGSLLDLFKSGGYGDDNLSDLGSILGSPERSSSWMEKGADLLGMLFGNNQSSILDLILGATGMKKEGGSMLMKILAPIVINKLAGMVFKNNWGASQLSSYLGEQKSSISGLVPGLSGLLGFAAESTSGSSKTTASSTSSYSGGGSSSGDSGGGMGWLKWLLPLLLGAGLLWWLTKDGCNKGAEADTSMTTDTTMVETGSTEGAMAEGSTTTAADGTSTAAAAEGSTSGSTGTVDYASLKFNDNGDIVDASGKVVYKGGSYGMDKSGNVIDDDGRILIPAASLPAAWVGKLKSYLGKYSGSKLSVDKAGNLVDETGKVIFAKGDYVEKDGFYYDKQGNKLGRIWAKILKAIGDAAEKTLDAMKSLFSDMVSKKAGAKTSYALSDIQWNKENHRITKFSKAEVEGLAAALKENANGKIVVKTFTQDGGDDKANKELSKTRAQVVHDMLVTLGVPKGQISFEGGGTGSEKVEIMVK